MKNIFDLLFISNFGSFKKYHFLANFVVLMIFRMEAYILKLTVKILKFLRGEQI